MARLVRQLIFLLYTLLLRWPIWLLIWIFGHSGMFKTLFLIYPTDHSECLDFCPDITWLRKFFAGRPTPTGLIMDGWRPVGIYLVIPNSALELMQKKNRPMVETIIKRMLWVQKLSRAKTIGLAGQLGPIFEKRHGLSMEPPFYSSTYGNIFSIQKAVSYLVKTARRNPRKVSVAVVGGGLLGEQLEKHLAYDGYLMSIVDIRYTRKGDVKLMDEEQASRQLGAVDFVINLLPRGKDFLGCRLHRQIAETAIIIDFSRPPIPSQAIPQRIVMGNRVQRNGMHFFMRLPGGWQRHELPACSMPSLVASLTALPVSNMADFHFAAGQCQFYTALADAPLRRYQTVGSRLRAFTALHPTINRCMLFFLRSRPSFSR